MIKFQRGTEAKNSNRVGYGRSPNLQIHQKENQLPEHRTVNHRVHPNNKKPGDRTLLLIKIQITIILRLSRS